MSVDEAGRDDVALGVDGLPRLLGDAADGGDATVTHAHIGTVAGRARAVHDGAVLDDQIVCHCLPQAAIRVPKPLTIPLVKRHYPDIGLHVPTLLLPRADVPLDSWAVVACDQYSSQPAYWDEVRRLVGGRPSTLDLILPEAHLDDDPAAAIAAINQRMSSYLDGGILEAHAPGFMLVERGFGGTAARVGLLVALDLDLFDYSAGAQGLIRSTEGTDRNRLPARIAVRREAPLEAPHIMVLIDDPHRTVIEPLLEQDLAPAYDVELMQGGGRVRGSWVRDAAHLDRVAAALADLRAGDPPLIYAMGDGNHSFAAAKAVWAQMSATAAPEHPGRYGLVELVNVHDETLRFEPIHRLLDGASPRALFAAMAHEGFDRRTFADREAWRRACAEPSADHRIPYIAGTEFGVVALASPTSRLPTATLHGFLDPFLEATQARIDYIHGDDVLHDLASAKDRVGFLLPALDKHDLFKIVIEDGATPRKTFSLGEAHEKRYYLECRRIR